MTDTNKLAELIKKAKSKMWGKTFHSELERNMFVADYLLTNGVIVPKCKRRQEFYDMWGSKKGKVEAIILDDSTETQTQEKIYYAYNMRYGEYESFTDEDIGKTVFLTKEQALAKLKECEGK
jgi:hypothetical protein